MPVKPSPCRSIILGFAKFLLIGTVLAVTMLAGPVYAEGRSDKSSDDAALSRKLSQYVTCFNSATNRVLDSKRRYLSWADEARGPTGKEKNIYGLYTTDADTCTRSVEAARGMSPAASELESAGEHYLQALQEIVPLLKKADTYYDQEDYKDDGMAEGKKMHQPLLAAFSKFEQANKVLGEKIGSLNDELTSRRLERLAGDESARLRYLAEKVMFDAKKLVKEASVSKLKELDTESYGAVLANYNSSVGALDEYSTAHPQEISKVSGYVFLFSALQDFQKSAKELLRRKKENRDFNTEFFSASSPELVKGHPAEVVKNYNDLVSRSNSTDF
jgi:hypothetical protein